MISPSRATEAPAALPMLREERVFLRGIPLAVWIWGFGKIGLFSGLWLCGLPTYAWLAFFAFDPWLFTQLVLPRSRGLLTPLTRFRTSRREVWLTIDDGPTPATTPQILDLLDAHEARATFFLVGQKVAAHPQLAAEIARRGHSIGNHTHTHSPWRFWAIGPKTLASEIAQCSQAVANASGDAPLFFRPPVGLKNMFLGAALARARLFPLFWSARGYDGLPRTGSSLGRILRRVQPGAIILVHENEDGAMASVALIAQLLGKLREQNYRCILPSLADLR